MRANKKINYMVERGGTNSSELKAFKFYSTVAEGVGRYSKWWSSEENEALLYIGRNSDRDAVVASQEDLDILSRNYCWLDGYKTARDPKGNKRYFYMKLSGRPDWMGKLDTKKHNEKDMVYLRIFSKSPKWFGDKNLYLVNGNQKIGAVQYQFGSDAGTYAFCVLDRTELREKRWNLYNFNKNTAVEMLVNDKNRWLEGMPIPSLYNLHRN
jgi:hypothetical protein